MQRERPTWTQIIVTIVIVVALLWAAGELAKKAMGDSADSAVGGASGGPVRTQ